MVIFRLLGSVCQQGGRESLTSHRGGVVASSAFQLLCFLLIVSHEVARLQNGLWPCRTPRFKFRLQIAVPMLLLITTLNLGWDAEHMTTFGNAGKAITLQPSSQGEQTLWTQTCPAGSSLCVVDHQWYGGAWHGYDTTRLRFYVDGEATASIDGQIFLSHGIGFADDAAPWSSGSLFGKTGSPSGVFNTFQIPFNHTIRCAALSTSSVENRFWWIYRGLASTDPAARVQLSARLALPPAARLRLHTTEALPVPAYAFVPLVRAPPTEGGAVLMTTLSVDRAGTSASLCVLLLLLQSPLRLVLWCRVLVLHSHMCAPYPLTSNYLEGCLRTYSNVTHPSLQPSSRAAPDGTRQLLSSGTEDYFLGTYYFNKGPYHTPIAGLTHKEDSDSRFSAYRTHVDEPLLWRPSAAAGAGGEFQLVWRNGDQGLCPDAPVITGDHIAKDEPVTLFAYVWAYHW